MFDNDNSYPVKLIIKQKLKLIQYLRTVIYLDVNSIIHHIEMSYGIKYFSSGSCSPKHNSIAYYAWGYRDEQVEIPLIYVFADDAKYYHFKNINFF